MQRNRRPKSARGLTAKEGGHAEPKHSRAPVEQSKKEGWWRRPVTARVKGLARRGAQKKGNSKGDHPPEATGRKELGGGGTWKDEQKSPEGITEGVPWSGGGTRPEEPSEDGKGGYWQEKKRKSGESAKKGPGGFCRPSSSRGLDKQSLSARGVGE